MKYAGKSFCLQPDILFTVMVAADTIISIIGERLKHDSIQN